MTECPVNVGDVLAEKYQVERILGHGGMGIVVAARHLELDQLVAMKFLLPRLAENREAAERFRREARAAVRIRSEYVARVLDVGTMMDGGVPYMVMEYLDGADLSTELQRVGTIELATAARLMLQTCEAIAAAHAVGIVHRDLKPANLFVTRSADQSRCVKVLDFGISKSLLGDSASSQLALTRTQAMVGSPLYMSPEQLESARHVDERTDVWSLGVILFEIVTGTVPFIGESIPQLVRAVLAGERQKISHLCPDLPVELDLIIDRCLSLKRDDRYSDVAELASALAPFADGGATSAARTERILRPPSGRGHLPRGSSALPFASGESPSSGVPVSLPQTTPVAQTPSGAGSAPGATVGPWNKTEGGSGSGSKRLVLGLSAAAVLGLAALGAQFLAPGAPDTSAHATSIDEALSAEPPAVPPSASSDTGDDAPSSGERGRETDVALPTPNVAPVASTAAAASATATAATSATQAPAVAAPIALPVRQPRPVARPRPAPKPKAPTTPEAPSGFTDFGGRR